MKILDPLGGDPDLPGHALWEARERGVTVAPSYPAE